MWSGNMEKEVNLFKLEKNAYELIGNLNYKGDWDNIYLKNGTYICTVKVDDDNWYCVYFENELQCIIEYQREVIDKLEKVEENITVNSAYNLVNHYFGGMPLKDGR